MNAVGQQARCTVFDGAKHKTEIVWCMKEMHTGMQHGTVLRNNEEQQCNENDVPLRGGWCIHLNW